MASSKGFRRDSDAIRIILAQPGVIAALVERGAQPIKKAAEDLSPVVTGQYRSGWLILAGAKDGRPAARVVNTVEHAYFLEHGTRYMARQRILGRAVEQVIAQRG